jgi:hypothetical protein
MVVGLALTVDPAVAQRHVERLADRDRRDSRVPLGDPQPRLGTHVVVRGQPGFPLRGGGKVEQVQSP